MKAKIAPEVNWKQFFVHYESIFLEAKKKKNTMIKNNVLIKHSAHTQRKNILYNHNLWGFLEH